MNDQHVPEKFRVRYAVWGWGWSKQVGNETERQTLTAYDWFDRRDGSQLNRNLDSMEWELTTHWLDNSKEGLMRSDHVKVVSYRQAQDWLERYENRLDSDRLHNIIEAVEKRLESLEDTLGLVLKKTEAEGIIHHPDFRNPLNRGSAQPTDAVGKPITASPDVPPEWRGPLDR